MAQLGMTRKIWAVAGAMVVVAAVVVVVAWLVTRDEESAGFEQSVTLSEVASDPQRFVGRTVTVSGTVSEALPEDASSPYALVLGEAAEAELLVVPRSAGMIPEERDDVFLRVTGRVQIVHAGARDEAPDVLAPAGVIERFRGEPAIYAKEITRVTQ